MRWIKQERVSICCTLAVERKLARCKSSQMPNCRRGDTEHFDQIDHFLNNKVIPAIREWNFICNEAANVVVNALLETGLDMMIHDLLNFAG
jgi:hypothetical protein